MRSWRTFALPFQNERDLFGGYAGPRFNPNWQYGYGYGNGGLGVVGVILVVFLILWLMGFV